MNVSEAGVQRSERLGVRATTVFVLGAALWTRVARLGEVVFDGTILPLDGDSAYHMRRIALTITDFPSVPVFDPWMGWPQGRSAPWAPGFDFAIAAVALLFPESLRPELVAMSPVLIGLAGVALGLAVARALGIRIGGYAASGVALAVLPQLVANGRFARVDHHGAEILVMTALGLWALALPSATQRWRWEAVGAGLVAAALLVFTGSIVYVGIAMMMIAVRIRREEPAGLGVVAFLGGAILATAIVPRHVAAHGSPWSYMFPSWLQPALVAAGACALGLLAVLARVRIRAKVVVGLVGALVVAGLSLGPIGSGLRAGAVGFLFTKDPWLATIAEFQPLHRRGWIESSFELWGVLGILAPLVIPTGLVAIVRRDRDRGIAFSVWTVLILVLALAQVRFGRLFTVNLAVCGGFALESLFARWGARGPVLAATALVVLDPNLRAMWTWRSPTEMPAVPEALLELRTLERRSDPGVLAPWDDGHSVLWLAERPVVSTGFGSFVDPVGFEEERHAWHLSEDELFAWMTERRLGFVLGGPVLFLERIPMDGQPLFLVEGGQGRLNPAALRAVPLARSVVGGSGIASQDVPHLQHFMPAVATRSSMTGPGLSLPGVWILERVVGATLVGRAEPGERVVIQTLLEVPQGRISWEGWGDADADGNFRIVSPMANGILGKGFRTEPRTRVLRQHGVTEVEVPEAAVREGHSIEIEDLPTP